MKQASRVTLRLVMVLAMAGLVLQVGSVPHLHAGQQLGLYNQEHDLTLLAGLASQGIASDAIPAVAPIERSDQFVQHVPERLGTEPAFSGDSRAPPLR
jgi:hypothetical protein